MTLIAFVVLAIIVYFTLFQKNTLLEPLTIDLLYMISQVLMGLILLALCVALRRASPSFIAIALTSGLVGLAVYLATETAFSMLSLSSQYAVATTDAQRSLFEAAGQAMLAEQVGAGTGTYMAFVLIGVAGLIIATVMLRSNIFSKVTASVGILANAITLAYYIGLPFVSMRPSLLIYSASGLVYLIWIISISGSYAESHSRRKGGARVLCALYKGIITASFFAASHIS